MVYPGPPFTLNKLEYFKQSNLILSSVEHSSIALDGISLDVTATKSSKLQFYIPVEKNTRNTNKLRTQPPEQCQGADVLVGCDGGDCGAAELRTTAPLCLRPPRCHLIAGGERSSRDYNGRGDGRAARRRGGHSGDWGLHY